MFKKLAQARHLTYLSRRLTDTPLAIEERAGRVVLNALSERLGLDKLAFDDEDEGYSHREGEGYQVIDGIAVIPIIGELCHRSGYLDAMSGLCSYGSIVEMVSKAVHDDNVKAILLDIDTPGGEIAGLYDAVDQIAALRGRKPIWAFSNERAFSAGYAIASAADKIIVSRTSGVGSIGVICFDTDRSGQYAKEGIAITPIHAGKLKADGADFQPLSDETRARIQAEVDQAYNLFTGSVARLRGMDEAKVKATEAGCYFGQSAVDNGLADAVSSFGNAMAALGGKTELTQSETAPNATVDKDSPMALEDVQKEEETTAKKRGAAENEMFDEDGNPLVGNDLDPIINDDEQTTTVAEDVEGDEFLDGLEDDEELSAEEIEYDEEGNPIKKETVPETPDAKKAAFNAAAIADMCAKAGAPSMAGSLIRSGKTLAQAKAALSRTAEVADIIKQAAALDPSLRGKSEARKVMAAAQGSPKKARELVFARLSGKSAATNISARTGTGPAKVGGKTVDEIRQARAKAKANNKSAKR